MRTAIANGVQVTFAHFLFQIFKCAWVLVIMASYWVTEALPLAITSLIPVALLPTLGMINYAQVPGEAFVFTDKNISKLVFNLQA